MHFLVTGGTGAGKTLFTLKWVRDLQLQSGRPVCYNKHLTLKPAALEFGWKQIDIREWEKEPDGTIFIVDECHKDFPTRGGAGAPPAYIQNLAEARHRGFDFFFITQHPKNMDVFIRRLIAAPGWHRHIKRRGGAPLAAVLQWDSVYERVEKNDSGEAGGAEVSNHPYPKHVYDWYESTTIDTAKFRIPKAAYAIAVAAVAGPALIYSAFSYMSGTPSEDLAQDVKAEEKSSGLGGFTQAFASAAKSPAASDTKVMTAKEYVDSHKPRLKDFPHTAPRYDQITQPAVAPYPAACVAMSGKCLCYTQQGTLLPATSHDICMQIVKQGYFVDWQQPAPEVRTVPVPGAPASPDPVAEWQRRQEIDQALTALAIRNAGPRAQR